MSVLVIAAHPDDEVLGCGGTIARRRKDGEDVSIAILGEGITSRSGLEAADATRLLEDLRQDALEAARILDVHDVRFFGLPDNRFDTVPLLDIIRIIEGLLDDVRPDTVFTQHGGDLNIDHRTVFRATLTACRPTAGAGVRSLYAYEVASSTEWAFGQFDPRFDPDHFVDISSFLATKLDAMEAYRSESRPAPHPRSRAALAARAAALGSVVGCAAAEAFATVYSRDLEGR